ncbi:hypothetical protein PJ985_11700 [Streptomyces sp. ACA25]|uniref:hypothetical protein n=1 Tax=Streptomyces sp. ACA25 TaxID=3022596 RepID=UPI0023082F42|nr:hypothetical protein [Streptomyces sp. ACA25]MDB1088227.1 hypothetical protein [Streptomyces sp. ACA25]
MHWHSRMRLTALAAGAALLLPATAPPASAAPVDEAGLREALLDQVDLPPGWAADSEQAAAERGIGVPTPREQACLPLFLDAAESVEARARADFARTPSGPFLVTTAASHDSEAAARAAVEAFTEATRECRTFQTEEGVEEYTVTIVYRATDLDVEGLGDESTAIRFHRQPETPDDPPVITDVVLVRVGEHTVRVAQAGRDDPGTENIEPLAERAAEKLREVSEGRTPLPPADQPGAVDL